MRCLEEEAIEYIFGVPGDENADFRREANIEFYARIAQVIAATVCVIAAFSDSAGKEKDNQRRSARRAKTLRHHLEGHGIDKARIASLGYGGSYPVASNASARKRNQRVDILLKAKGR